MFRYTLAVSLPLTLAVWSVAAESSDTARADESIAAYFQSETQILADRSLAEMKTFGDWKSRRAEYRRQLIEMLGLDQFKDRTPLRPVVTRTLDHADFKVENLHFQSLPHLYVTGNLYLPKKDGKPAPTVLYLCGHHAVKNKGTSFGNKTWYQYHGQWLAQNGYVCLVIDTLQLGEIEGSHAGTRRENKWWWNARGYTPAGVETWNAVRALDYLVSRPEVDSKRIGVTGRSGGGAYSWFLAAVDDRPKVIVPVAGITSLKNHVVDRCVTGHCDCMYFVNTYRWDYSRLAALSAPRPLLIANTDRDHIFPLDGVLDIYHQLRRLYELNDRGADVALQITPGPHSDGQVLQLQALQWFDRHLKGQTTPTPVNSAATPHFDPAELKVFDRLPPDEINTRIDELFVPLAAEPSPPESSAEWQAQREEWMKSLREKSFRAWPAEEELSVPKPLTISHSKVTINGDRAAADATHYEFTSQNGIELPLLLIERPGTSRDQVKRLIVWPLNADEWTASHVGACFTAGPNSDAPPEVTIPESVWPASDAASDSVLVVVPLRGVGPTAWTSQDSARTHIRRQFMLLGQTLDGMCVWDLRRAIQSVGQLPQLTEVPLELRADGPMAGIALYAALFEPHVARLHLRRLSATHRQGPDFLNVLRILDVPQTVAMVAEKTPIELTQDDDTGWEYASTTAKNLGWDDRIIIHSSPEN